MRKYTNSLILYLLLILITGTGGCSTTSVNSTNVAPAETVVSSPTPPNTIRELIDVICNGDVAAQISATINIRNLSVPFEEAIPCLSRNLQLPNTELREVSAEALGNFGADATAAVPQLIVSLLTDANSVQIEAAIALGKIGDTSAVPALAQALEEGQSESAVQSAEVLGHIVNRDFSPNPSIGQEGFQDEDSGLPWIVLNARKWWIEYGRQQHWITP